MLTRTFTLMALILTLGGCMPLGKKGPPPVVYQLHAPTAGLMAQPPAVPAGTDIEVALPSVPAGYDKDRIALALDNGRRLDYYTGARWAENLPDVLQDVISSSLRQTFPGLVVDDDENLPSATHRLRVEVLRFTPVYAGGANSLPTVRVSLRFALMDLRRNRVLLDITQATDVAPDANTLTAVTAALETGLHRTLHDVMPRMAGMLAPPAPAKR